MKKLLFVLFVVFIFGLSCKNDPCLKGSGNTIIENRSISSELKSIKLLDNLKLEIYIDSLDYIELQGGENVIPFIDTKMDGNTLVIENRNKCKFLRGFDRDLVLSLHISSLNVIEYSSSRNLTMHDTLKVNQFSFTSFDGSGSVKLLLKSSGNVLLKSIGGSSDITIFGNAPTAGFYNSGTAWINAREFYINSTTVQSESTGDCIVNAENSLVCVLNGIGNIQYLGNPIVKIVENTGNGKIFKIN